MLEIADLQLMRGQFRYLRVCGLEIRTELDSLWWEPKLYGADDFEPFLILFLCGLALKGQCHLSDSDQDTLCDAGNDLQKALNKSQSASPAYGAILGRCYYSLGRFREAAAQHA